MNLRNLIGTVLTTSTQSKNIALEMVTAQLTHIIEVSEIKTPIVNIDE